MEFIIDANEVFSMVIAQGRKRQTAKLDLLFSDHIKLYAPGLLFRELEKNKEEIKTKAGFNDVDFEVFMEILRLRIETVLIENYADCMEQAKKICPHVNDIHYFALALKKKCPLWSGDRQLKEQTLIKVVNTKELIELLDNV